MLSILKRRSRIELYYPFVLWVQTIQTSPTTAFRARFKHIFVRSPSYESLPTVPKERPAGVRCREFSENRKKRVFFREVSHWCAMGRNRN